VVEGRAISLKTGIRHRSTSGVTGHLEYQISQEQLIRQSRIGVVDVVA
jgi:hypothetical protein